MRAHIPADVQVGEGPTILITSGGTSENIDSVRRITNMSKGTLGRQVAVECLEQVPGCQIIFVAARDAIAPPEDPRIELIRVTDTASVSQCLRHQLTERRIDFVVHAMAISDYTPAYAHSVEELAGAIVDCLHEGMDREHQRTVIEHVLNFGILADDGGPSGKIRSSHEHLMVGLRRTPKVINQIKQHAPNVFLVGFKLLVGSTEDELVRAAREQIKRAGSDLVFANDLEAIKQHGHAGCFVFADESSDVEHVQGLPMTAHRIVELMLQARKES